jgi:hypothetical protein
MAFIIEKTARKPAVLPLLFRDGLIDSVFRRISSTRGLPLQPLVHSGEA